MFSYYLDLALRSLRRYKAVTALMIVAIGLGIGASMTMLTLLHVMSADPLPGISGTLFYPQIEPRDRNSVTPTTEPLPLFTWTDAMNLLHDRRADMQAAMTSGSIAVYPVDGSEHATLEEARFTTPDFFPMFKVPFLHGQGWTADDEERESRVVVLSRALADRLFGADRAVGRSIRLGNQAFRVIGVMDRWQPVPFFYDLTKGAYARTEDVFLPLHTAMGLHMSSAGSVMCWGDDDMNLKDMTHASSCAWLQYWAKLDSPQKVDTYRDYLIHYSEEQKTLGRFQLPPDVHLRDVMGWLDANQVIPGSVQLQALLAVGFLLVCLINTLALLLVKFTRRSGELSVRRAMGASRADVFMQLLFEAAVVGAGGGLLGLALASLGLWVVRQQASEYARLAQMDTPMLLSSVALAIFAALAAALFPAWRACRVAPAMALKVQ